MASGADDFAKQMGKLYLNDKMSDVAVIVDGVKLPAHRLILAQRCEYFDVMFESGMIEATSNRIEVREASLDSVKLVLKWIYTGETDLISIDNAFEVIRLAHMYQIKQLVDEAVDCFMENCTIENVCLILNEAVLLSLDELIKFSIERVTKAPLEALKHETFKQLSTDALKVILTHCVKVVSNNDIFRVVVNWMNANPTKSADFPDVLMNVSLSTLTLEDLAAVPTDVLDAPMLLGLYRQQQLSNPDAVHKVINENVAVPKYGVSVIVGGDTKFFDGEPGFLVHEREQTDGIIIDLGRRNMLNLIKMELAKFIEFSYFIEVSEDNVDWTRVIDHSKYVCRSLQNLYFDVRPVRFVRICCIASGFGHFYLARFEAYCTNKLFEIDPETTLLVPSDNVSIPEKTAFVTKISYPEVRYERFQAIPTTVHNNGVMVQLFQPYLIGSMKLEFYEGDVRAHRYIVEVSVDRVHWNRVFIGENNALRKITFDKQPVTFIKFTGIYDDATALFQSYRFQCPAVSE
uniref:BTB domain-containing protein n=1 Tax=Panagrellus redivivus TaxID=6233 RepID=A0A7E4ZR92_PANRE